MTELSLIKITAVDKHATSAVGERIGKNEYKNGNRLILYGIIEGSCFVLYAQKFSGWINNSCNLKLSIVT